MIKKSLNINNYIYKISNLKHYLSLNRYVVFISTMTLDNSYLNSCINEERNTLYELQNLKLSTI